MAIEGATSGRSGPGSQIRKINKISKAPARTPAPVFQPRYKAPPTYQFAPNAGPNNIWSGGGNSGGGGFSLPAGPAYSAPAPAPAPIPEPPRETYSLSDPNSRIAGVDSTFRDQESMYNESLKKFIADIGRRRDTLKSDTTKAQEGVARNKDLGLKGIGEDFASRGLGYSGLFADASQKGTEAYERQNTSLIDAQTTGLGDLSFTENKEKSDNTARIQAAKRDALYRLQLKNNLVTGL